MNKPSIEQLSHYLPYGLKVKLKFSKPTELPWYYQDKEIYELEGMMLDWYNSSNITKIKPYLRPLSDITDDVHPKIEFYTTQMIIDDLRSQKLEMGIFIALVKNHFDVFFLIEKGLAFNINKIKVEE